MNEHIKQQHAQVMREIALGMIVDHGDTAGMVFADDSPHCQCDDCIELPDNDPVPNPPENA